MYRSWMYGILYMPVIKYVHTHTYTQDWFNSRLKQVVMDLTNQGPGTSPPLPPVSVRVSVEGMGSGVDEEDGIEPERDTLDLLE